MSALSRALTTALVLALPCFASFAAVQAPLHIGTTNRIVDERGQTLPGTDPSAAQFGQPVVNGDLVQVIRTYNGTIEAPDTNGVPSGSNNIVVATTRIGFGVDPATGATGQFGLSLPAWDGGPVFVRVFNSADLAGASFYGNSQVYSNTANYSVFIPVVTGVQPLDNGDADSDGLINSWEKSLGTDPGKKDTDSDGIDDNNEFLAGTDGTNPGDFFGVARILPGLDGSSIIYWNSVSGKTYQVQSAAGDIATAAFADLGISTEATGATTFIIHTNGLSATNTHYRVRLVQ